jgi:signal transduction histidine kinase/ActR/RegA family two-component response regulator
MRAPLPAKNGAPAKKRDRRIAFREDAAKAVSTRETTVTGRELVVLTREEAAVLREEAVNHREDAAALREEAAQLREEAAQLREETVAAREEAEAAKAQLNQYLLQLREANQGLVIATLQSQALAEKAEEATRLKDEFLAVVSHELRTPLSAVTGWARMLRSNQLHTERVPHAIAAIDRNASLLQHLVEDLLDTSRMTTGTLQVGLERVDLDSVIEAALETIKHAAAAKDIHVQVSPAPLAADPVLGDARRLQQVIWNLVSNAIKFTPEGGRVDLAVRRVASTMEIRVADTGQGIAADFLPLVFDRFRQADASPRRRDGGLGLGLAIVREIVELHRGQVRAESPGLGLGTTIVVTLPVVPAPAASPSSDLSDARGTVAAEAFVQPLRGLDHLRVLIVEDNADSRELLTLVLESAGARVTSVTSTRDALALLELEQPDAVVSDIGLPDADGYAFIRQLRAREAERGGFLPAMALTGYSSADDQARAVAAGYQCYMAKPAEPIALTRALAKIVAATAAAPRH